MLIGFTFTANRWIRFCDVRGLFIHVDVAVFLELPSLAVDGPKISWLMVRALSDGEAVGWIETTYFDLVGRVPVRPISRGVVDEVDEFARGF